VKDLLEHASLAMTLQSAHLSPEHLRSAVSVLDVHAEITSSRAQARAQKPLDVGVLVAN